MLLDLTFVVGSNLCYCIYMVVAAELGPQADFFIHPDYHRLGGYPMSARVEKYEAALHERIDRSSLPILLYAPGMAENAGDFWDRFPAQQRFPTLPDRGSLEQGYKANTSFNRLLSDREVLGGVVHGSYLEACVKGFKKSLNAFGQSGVLYVRSPFQIGYVDDISQPDTVKYGIVLSKRNGLRHVLPEFENTEAGLPPKYYSEDAFVFQTD